MLNFLHPSSLAARATACSTDAGDTRASSHTASMTLAVAAPGGRAVKTRPATAVPPPPPPPPSRSGRRNSHCQLGIVSPPRRGADRASERSPRERKSVVEGKRVDLGGRRIIKKKKERN